MPKTEQFIHPAFQLLHETGRPRVPEIRTQGRGRFTIFPIPPLYNDECGVVRDVFFQQFPPGSQRTSAQQFSAMLILSFEEWRTKENVGRDARLEDICSWRLQVYPPDNELMRALDAPASNGSIMDQLKDALNMLQEVPLALGCAFVLRFGHRGAEYPYLEVEADFGFGSERVKAQIAQKIAEFDAYESKLGVRAWRIAQRVLGADVPQRPKSVEELPDLWADHQHIKIVLARMESILQSLVRRVENRPHIAQLMASHRIARAPGDHNTVAIMGEAAERGITARQIKRAGGVTVYRPGADLTAGMLAMHENIRESMKPQGLGRASDSVAPPPPPKDVRRSVVPDEGLAPTSVEIIDPDAEFVDTRPARAPTPNLAERPKKR